MFLLYPFRLILTITEKILTKFKKNIYEFNFGFGIWSIALMDRWKTYQYSALKVEVYIVYIDRF